MVYYGAKELAFSSRTVRKNTIVIATEIPEEKYGFKPTPEYRSVAQLLAHIAMSYLFQYEFHAVDKRHSFEGIDFPSLMARLAKEEARPRSKTQILDLLKEEGETWARWEEGLPEEFLSQMIGMPEGAVPAAKSRFEMILSVKEHEMHHRGQLMLMERLLGIVPHPTREREERMRQSR
jgi:uncharacterized damage-inducible protein DinB